MWCEVLQIIYSYHSKTHTADSGRPSAREAKHCTLCHVKKNIKAKSTIWVKFYGESRVQITNSNAYDVVIND